MKLYRLPSLRYIPVFPAPRTIVGTNNWHCACRFLGGSNATFHHRSSLQVSYSSQRSASKLASHQSSFHPANVQHLSCFSPGRAFDHTARCDTYEPVIHSIFENKTGTWQYVVADPSSLSAVIIDPVLNFDPVTQVITTDTADSLLSLVKYHHYEVIRILETHIHADHLTAASYIQHSLFREQARRPPICIGKRIEQLQDMFGRRYGISAHEYQDAFDQLLDDDEIFSIGKLDAQAVHLPGHTPDHLGYRIGDNVFCGDSIFHTDIGTARSEFPGGDAASLYRSGRKLLALPDHVKIWTGHDYPPLERSDPVPWLSVQEHRTRNKHLMEGSTEAVFVALRHDRHAKLAEPRLLHQSLQMNIRAGRLPEISETGQRMLHRPVKLHCSAW